MTSFEDLHQKRRAYIEAARDNGFEQGLRRLLADLYPDNAHFIYELLQNAEDARAREVLFDLRHDGLRVEHDGTRLFSLRDVDSITGIGQSTKADDATSIGKFGVGFKAVYAYTQRPVVHSGDIGFAIEDLFVPVPLPGVAGLNRTRFWLPFDRTDKAWERANREVDAALRGLSRTTLLFLRNIELITCVLPNGDKLRWERRDVDDHVVEIDSRGTDEEPSYWYRIQGEVALENTSYPIAAAFALEVPSSSARSDVGSFTVRPVDGQVFIYFPAVRETSALKFHVHAPFASTVARDSVRDDRGNDALIAGIADLVATALPEMRDSGLLTDGLLAALPNPDDYLPVRYIRVRDRIRAAFRDDAITPTASGGFGRSIALLRADKGLASALTVDDANFLRQFGLAERVIAAQDWLAVREGRPRAFLNSLDSIGFGRDELTAAFGEAARRNGGENYPTQAGIPQAGSAWSVWISAKSDDWLRRFYIALEAAAPSSKRYTFSRDPAANRYVASVKTAPLLRVQAGTGVAHVAGSQAYLPVSRGLTAAGLVVDALTFPQEAEGITVEDLTTLAEFYDRAGVRQWDAAAQLDARLNQYHYQQQPPEITPEHLADLATLARLAREKVVSLSSYSARRFLVALTPEGRRHWRTPAFVYRDDPSRPTGLKALYESDRYPDTRPGQLDPGYLAVGPEVKELITMLGVRDGLRFAEANVRKNREFDRLWAQNENSNRVEADWDIEHFDLIVALGEETLLRELWRLIATGARRYAEAEYRANASRRVHPIRSQILQRLTTTPWVLDRDGNLRLPQDVTAVELDEELHLPDSAPLLDVAGFGQRAANVARKQGEEEEFAKKLGFGSSEDLRRVASLHQRDPERLRAMLDQAEYELRLPEAATAAPERRAQRVGEIASGASPRRYETRSRSVYMQEPGHLSASRGYLRRMYTNSDGILVCQICAGAMPFKIGEEYYFEAVQFVRNTSRDLHENRLALCPICAAMYRHACDKAPDELRSALFALDVGLMSSVTMEVALAGTRRQLRFVGKHAIDLQAALRLGESAPSTDGTLDAQSNEAAPA